MFNYCLLSFSHGDKTHTHKKGNKAMKIDRWDLLKWEITQMGLMEIKMTMKELRKQQRKLAKQTKETK